MFDFLKRKTQNEVREVRAPLAGTAISVDQVPDPVFAQKMLGDGAAVIAQGGTVYSPVDGTIGSVVESKHAVGILTADGLELIVHIGLDTVRLGGVGFTLFVEPGNTVKTGDKLMEIDLELLQKENLRLHSPVVITDIERIEIVTRAQGSVKAVDDVLFTYRHR